MLLVAAAALPGVALTGVARTARSARRVSSAHRMSCCWGGSACRACAACVERPLPAQVTSVSLLLGGRLRLLLQEAAAQTWCCSLRKLQHSTWYTGCRTGGLRPMGLTALHLRQRCSHVRHAHLQASRWACLGAACSACQHVSAE